MADRTGEDARCAGAPKYSDLFAVARSSVRIDGALLKGEIRAGPLPPPSTGPAQVINLDQWEWHYSNTMLLLPRYGVPSLSEKSNIQLGRLSFNLIHPFINQWDETNAEFSPVL